ncbi:MAG: spore coat biosynthesis protein F [Armatimonadetes bacterium]|nr:spore coat biosynthesis protein F [Armatimonadota bacterium]
MEIINVLACIQARMGSKRFPGKVMALISGKPLIAHIIQRLKKSREIEKIVLAASEMKENDILEEIAKKEKIDIFRGRENNVLERFYGVIKKYNPRHIVRICADNPLIDAGEIDKIIHHHIKSKADYSFNHIPAMNNNYPDGLGAEIFKSNIISEIYKKTKIKRHLEHINEYIWDNLKKFHVETLKAPSEIAYPEIKLDVDTKKDLNFIRDIYKNLYKGKYFGGKRIINYLKSK